MRILIVSEDSSKGLVEVCRSRGHNVVELPTPAQIPAWIALGRGPDLVIVADTALDAAGLAALRAARASGYAGKFVVMSWPDREAAIRELGGIFLSRSTPKQTSEALMALLE